MKNNTNERAYSRAELERLYPELVRQIRLEAAHAERQRLRQLYCTTPYEDGETLMEQAAGRYNQERRARSH